MKTVLLAFSLLSTTTFEHAHVVEKGDTLTQIAYENEISLWQLAYLNPHIDDLNSIQIGDVILTNKEMIDDSSINEKDKGVAEEKVNKVFEKEPIIIEETQTKRVGQASITEKDYKEMIVESTAYTAYCNGCSGITATGLDIKSNPNLKVIAVDPNVIPLGSKVWVEGYGEAIAADTGGAIKGNKIDVFIPLKEDALAWGRKKIKIKVYK